MRKRTKKADRDYITSIKDIVTKKEINFPLKLSTIHSNPSGIVERKLGSGKISRKGRGNT